MYAKDVTCNQSKYIMRGHCNNFFVTYQRLKGKRSFSCLCFVYHLKIKFLIVHLKISTIFLLQVRFGLPIGKTKGHAFLKGQTCFHIQAPNLTSHMAKGDVFVTQSYTIVIFIYLGFYVAFNTVQVISRRVVGRAEEASTYSSLGFCTVNCRPTASNYQESNPGLRGGRQECYHSATMAPICNSYNQVVKDHPRS